MPGIRDGAATAPPAVGGVVAAATSSGRSSSGSGTGVGMHPAPSSQPLLFDVAAAAAPSAAAGASSQPRGTGRAPRTSFTYSSRPLSQGDGPRSVAAAPTSAGTSVSTAANTVPAAVPVMTGSVERPHSPRAVSVEAPAALSVAPPLPETSPAPCAAVGSSGVAVLAKMDTSQVRAATFPPHAPLLLQAGAGSGKTQTMAARVAYLLELGVPGHALLGICFTRQAAETLRERVRATLPDALARQAHTLKLKTFHAFGLECLRRFGALAADTPVLDARQQHQLARRVVDTYALREKSSEAVAELVDYANRVKTMRVPPVAQSDPNVQDAYLFPHYQRVLHEEHGAVDFGDLQQMFYELLRPVPAAAVAAEHSSGGGGGGRLVPSPVCAALRDEFTHFVVDEFQDFNEIQVELLALLAGDACRVTCVGDPNQCIYTWRGAMPNVFGVWRKRFPQTTELTLAMNYRSDGPIVEAANRVVKATQLAHHHREERAVTLVQCASEEEELQAVPLVLEHVLRRRDSRLGYGDVAILCRSRRRVQLYCDVLQAQRIPVRQLAGMAVDHLGTMRSLLALLRLCVAPHGPEADADVRTVLLTAPLHRLPANTAKKFLLALDSVCQARRTAEAAQIRAWRHTISTEDALGGCGCGSNSGGPTGPGAACAPARGAAGGVPGVRPEAHSFFGVLQELVYHNFSRDVFPKLEVSKKNQKSLRAVVRIILYARDLLAQASCDVEQLLRYVLREGGYESNSMTTVAATMMPIGGAKRTRSGSGRAGARVGDLIAESCAAVHSSSASQRLPPQQQQQGGDGGWDCRSVGAPTPHPPSGRRGAAGGGGGDDEVLPPEEEAAVWQEQRMNLCELVLHTYRVVQEALNREVAHEAAVTAKGGEGGGGADEEASRSRPSPVSGTSSRCGARAFPRDAEADSISSLSASNATTATTAMTVTATTTTAATVMQELRPPAVVLRRVLDEFVSLVASDDYGPMRDAGSADGTASAAAASSSSRWVGQVTVGTVHRAKGMEWPAVLLPGCWVGEYPVRPREEERRVFYVGMSRAMKHLVCFTAARREGSGGGGGGEGGPAAGAVGADAVGPQHCPGSTLEPTPYLAAVGENLERVTYAELKAAHLKEMGYT